MKTKRQLESENARMRTVLERLGAALEKVKIGGNDGSVWLFVGGAEVLVCEGLALPLYVDGAARFTRQRVSRSDEGVEG